MRTTTRTRRHPGRQREGLVVVDGGRRVVLVDQGTRDLLGEEAIAADQVVPSLFLEADAVEVERPAGSDGPRRIEVRARRAAVDGDDGWTLTVVDASRRRSPKQEASDMVAAVSHEMRTPLTAITGYAATIRHHWDTLDAAHKLEFLEVIERQGMRLARLTSDLLNLAKADAGRLEVEAEDVALGRAVAETLEAMPAEAADVRVVGDGDVSVRADPLHLADILTNFVTNAGKYGRPPVTLEMDRVGGEGVVRVRDEGDGVPEGFVARMWDRFARARVEERPPGATGSGLGLAVVRHMAELNGGRAWYEPNEPRGSCFAVALPLAPTDGTP